MTSAQRLCAKGDVVDQQFYFPFHKKTAGAARQGCPRLKGSDCEPENADNFRSLGLLQQSSQFQHGKPKEAYTGVSEHIIPVSLQLLWKGALRTYIIEFH